MKKQLNLFPGTRNGDTVSSLVTSFKSHQLTFIYVFMTRPMKASTLVPYTKLTNISSICKRAKFTASTVIKKCMNDFRTVLKNFWIKRRLSHFCLHHYQQFHFAEIQLPLLLLFLEIGVALLWFQRRGAKFEVKIREKGQFSKTSNACACI